MNFKTSQTEIEHLLKAWFAISIAFAIALFGFSMTLNFVTGILISGLTVGIGFLIHELGHKIIAQHFGCFAEFRANINMLILAILISFTGFIIAAPGAVMISGHVSTKKNGLIAAAGPLMNLILAFFFLILSLIGIFKTITYYGLLINSWLAFFNLIPLGFFDGAKIMRWNKGVYAGLVIAAMTLMISSSVV